MQLLNTTMMPGAISTNDNALLHCKGVFGGYDAFSDQQFYRYNHNYSNIR